MGQTIYTHKALHTIRHMFEYIAEVKEGTQRPEVLKEKLADVKQTSHSLYRDAFSLINYLDETGITISDFFWKKTLEAKKLCYDVQDRPYGDYSPKNIITICFFSEYQKEVLDGNLSESRRNQLKEELGTVMELAMQLYYDAKRLISQIDD